MKNLTYALLILVGSGHFFAHVVGLNSVDRFFGSLFMSPRPYPFVGLPRNEGALNPYQLQFCAGSNCEPGNYLDEVALLPGGHRFRAPFYLLVLEDLTTPLHRVMIQNILCGADFLPRNKSRPNLASVNFRETAYACK